LAGGIAECFSGTTRTSALLLNENPCTKAIGRFSFYPFSELIDDAIKHSKSENDEYVADNFELKMNHIRSKFCRRDGVAHTAGTRLMVG
jgi:hypothetical protein